MTSAERSIYRNPDIISIPIFEHLLLHLLRAFWIKILNNVEERQHPSLKPFVTLIFSGTSFPTFPNKILSYKYFHSSTYKYFKHVFEEFHSVFHNTSNNLVNGTILSAFSRSIKIKWILKFHAFHFSVSCLNVNILSH